MFVGEDADEARRPFLFDSEWFLFLRILIIQGRPRLSHLPRHSDVRGGDRHFAGIIRWSWEDFIVYPPSCCNRAATSEKHHSKTPVSIAKL